MANYPGASRSPGLPRPTQVVTFAMGAVFALWLAFAVGTHWGGMGNDVFLLFCGNTVEILHGQVWRLVTAPLLHDPNSGWQIVFAVAGLYFFGVPLEESFGKRRFVWFLLALVLGSTLIQALSDVALPLGVRRIFADDYWFGADGVVSGLVVAWCVQNRGKVVHLWGILPLSTTIILGLTLGGPLIYLLFRETPSEGVFGYLGGCFVGWLLGASTPSPLRRYWLKLKLNRLDAEVAREAKQRRGRVERSNLKVIEGGRARTGSPPDGEKGRGPDGRWLN